MPWSDLANVYLKQDKLKEAVSIFQRTLKCNPPPAEKTAILQDIADITKILKMQGQPPTPNAVSSRKAPQKQSPTHSEHQPKSTGLAGSMDKEGAVPEKIDTKTLKTSGWDWVYDKK